ncbi:chemotaxis protein CheW [Thioclava sp. 'Guangxiensis']|uniref:chemotaxis protein CheW n=1 Tax=Thioclava sp. 'Guangxiensis' TaxID=3149044 RepID=UPI003877CD07
MMKVVTLILGTETLAIPTSALREILEPVPVTRVPQAGRFATGLINVRGGVVPLADLRIALNMKTREPDENTRMLVLDISLAGEVTTVAVLADRVLDVTDIDDGAIDPIPEVGMRWPPDFVKGIALMDEKFVIIPDLERIFAIAVPGSAAHSQNEQEPAKCV